MAHDRREPGRNLRVPLEQRFELACWTGDEPPFEFRKTSFLYNIGRGDGCVKRMSDRLNFPRLDRLRSPPNSVKCGMGAQE
jgi:hypothetical protein